MKHTQNMLILSLKVKLPASFQKYKYGWYVAIKKVEENLYALL
jgi:hypothetical protein